MFMAVKLSCVGVLALSDNPSTPYRDLLSMCISTYCGRVMRHNFSTPILIVATQNIGAVQSTGFGPEPG